MFLKFFTKSLRIRVTRVSPRARVFFTLRNQNFHEYKTSAGCQWAMPCPIVVSLPPVWAKYQESKTEITTIYYKNVPKRGEKPKQNFTPKTARKKSRGSMTYFSRLPPVWQSWKEFNVSDRGLQRCSQVLGCGNNENCVFVVDKQAPKVSPEVEGNLTERWLENRKNVWFFVCR